MKIKEIASLASVIPVIEIDAIERAAPLASALAKGGLRIVELTMRSDCACAAISEMKASAPSLIVGMGTVKTKTDIQEAADHGADFLVTPGASAQLLKALVACGVPALPGVATGSEAMAAYEAGFHMMKFFPAEAAGGIPYLKSLAGPFAEFRFCPTGGISHARAPDYLALPNVECVGGSWIASKKLIASKNWSEIESNARKAAALSR